jgi:hypothetical protein
MTAEAPPRAPDEALPPPPPPPAAAAEPVSKWFVAGLVALPTILILLTMSGALGPILRDGQSLWRLPYLLVANTPTGGDMGAHVLLPKVLMESVIPSGRIMGWSMDWYAGFPVLYFYFPLPALTTVALDLILPYGVAFKLVTIVGLVALPVCAYLLSRFMGFPRIIAAVAGVAGSLMVFMESYSIFGANIKSTLAGMFSFSWSFAFSILYVGLIIRNYRQGRRFAPVAGIVLGLAALSHIIAPIVLVITTLPLVVAPAFAWLSRSRTFSEIRDGALGVASSWIVGFAISAFFTLALGVRVLEGMTSDMGWAPVRTIVGAYQAPGSPLPGELIPVLVVAVVGIVWTLFRRDDVSLLLWMTLWPLVGYFVIAHFEWTILYNARLLPYWFFGLYTFAGLAIGLTAVAIGRRFAERRRATLIAAAAAVVLMVATVAVSMHDLPGWVKWNYEGYEGKQDWPEYENLMATVNELPDGRIMWEANSDMNRYGTPMALMLFPFWSEGHPSMEGLFFESSLTTPFHFLNAAEVSARPSNPVRGLTYRSLDFDRATKHLAVYDVAYYVSWTDEARSEAEAFGLEVLAEPDPWTVFALPDSDLVDVATMEPVVWAGDADFVDAALEWYDDVDNLDAWLVEDGPAEWRRVTSVDERLLNQRPYASTTSSVTVTTFEDHEVSFTTDAVGVPHLVKVSYFPNWQVSGAEGVYRVAPSLMLVIPTAEEVTLQFGRTWVEVVGAALTLTAVVGLGVYTVVRIRKRRNSDV